MWFVSSVLAIVTLALIGGFLNGLHPAFDSLSHFRMLLAHIVLGCAITLWYHKRRLPALLAIVLAAASYVSVWPFFGAADATTDQGEKPVFSLLQINANFNNPAPQELLRLIGTVEPDVITMQEVSGLWREQLAKIAARYPYQHICTASRRTGPSAIVSRRPFTPGKTPVCIDDGSTVIALVNFGGTDIAVTSVHLHWPWPFHQPDQISGLLPALKQLGANSVIAGDFNATPWSESLLRIAEASGGQIMSPGATWMYRRLPQSLAPSLGLPIDIVLAGADIERMSLERLHDVGSDHRPVLLRFALNSQAPAEPLDPPNEVVSLNAGR
jgi:endonuclease/exonuclease/phosphatase (EEP) superfamily protein YafD